MLRTLKRAWLTLCEALAPAPGVDPGRLGVRPAVPSDLDALQTLNGEFAAEQAARWGIDERSLLRSRNHLKQAIADRQAVVLVATLDGTAVGYALADVVASDGKTSAWLDAVFVQPRIRRSPLAEWLAREVVARLPAAGASEVITRVRAQDHESTGPLRHAGLEDRFRIMRLAVVHTGRQASARRAWAAAGRGRR